MPSNIERFATGDPYTRLVAAALRELFEGAYAREFSIDLWDGTHIPAQHGERFTFHLNTPGALRAACSSPIDLSVGRALGAGLIDVDGDLEAAVDLIYRVTASISPLQAFRLWRILRRLPNSPWPSMREAKLRGRVHSRRRDRAAIGFHYDQPLAFFASFLDPELVYSCAYYDAGVDSLADAQLSKLDYTLRKLRLRPGERLLDIGCGWGTLVIRAAQRFGAIAVGITLSANQYEEAKRRIDRAGVGDRVRVELLDYRDIGRRRFDKVVSVGMFEHVGHSRIKEYFRAAFDALRPGGLFLNHAIADRRSDGKDGRVYGFMEHFIFPDGELVPIAEALRAAEAAGFEIRDVENLREHYVRTLRAWIGNLERNAGEARAAAGEQAYRLWRLYLAGSAQGFSVGRLGIFQSLLARPDELGGVGLPATRRDLYAAGSNGRFESAESTNGSTRITSR